jgi:putative permease
LTASTPPPARTSGAGELFPSLARALLLLCGLVAVLWFLARIQQALLLGTLVLVLAITIEAPVGWLERRRGWRRGPALAVVFLALLAVAAGLLRLLVPPLLAELPALVVQVSTMAQGVARELGERFGMGDALAAQVDRLVAWTTGAAQEAWRFAGSLVAGIVMAIVTTALVLYVVADPRPLVAGTLRAVPPHLRERTARALARGARMVVAWVGANALMGLLKAAAAFVYLTVVGIPGAVVWALLAFFSALVPQVGFYVMSVPPVLMAFAIEPRIALWTALFFWGLSTFLGSFVAPYVQGERMKLHPAYLLGMTVAMGYAFGVLGVLVAAPVAGFLKAFFDAFWLELQPEDPPERTAARVDAILARNPGALGGWGA